MNPTSVAGLKRAFNFNAGPAALPLPVLERVREELLDWHGTGMSVMEMSHRSPEFEGINAAAEAGLRKHLGIPAEYAVIFVQGGGSMQFTMAPMNLCLPGKPVDVLHTGAWTAKAIAELKKGVRIASPASSEAAKFMRVPRPDEISLSPDASYVYLCTQQHHRRNAVDGVSGNRCACRWSPTCPRTSRRGRIDVKKFGLIFAGAQKNLGPSGVTVVIVRKDLAERADKNLPTLLQYRTHIKEKSLYQTPPTFAVYIVGLVMEWIESQGGLAAIERRNEAKAKLLYDAIDAGRFYGCPVEKGSRSKMNVVFRVAGGDEALEKKFAEEAAAAGIVGTAGHRSVGGMRASLYNAVTPEAVEALVGFMREFQRTRG